MNVRTLQAAFQCDGAGADTINCGHMARNLHIIDGICITTIDRTTIAGRPFGVGANSHYDWYIELHKYNGEVQQLPHRYVETPGPGGPIGGGFLYHTFENEYHAPWPIDWAECDVDYVVIELRNLPANGTGWVWIRWREFG